MPTGCSLPQTGLGQREVVVEVSCPSFVERNLAAIFSDRDIEADIPVCSINFFFL